MGIADYLQVQQLPLYGTTISDADSDRLISAISGSKVLQAYSDVLRSFRLCGVPFVLAEDQDLSGVGVELQWLTPNQIISEALDMYPGIIVTKMGFIPVGMCLMGSGNYYYIDAKSSDPLDPPLVRIPYDGVTSTTTYAEEMIEPVSKSLTDFFKTATMDDHPA